MREFALIAAAVAIGFVLGRSTDQPPPARDPPAEGPAAARGPQCPPTTYPPRGGYVTQPPGGWAFGPNQTQMFPPTILPPRQP